MAVPVSLVDGVGGSACNEPVQIRSSSTSTTDLNTLSKDGLEFLHGINRVSTPVIAGSNNSDDSGKQSAHEPRKTLGHADQVCEQTESLPSPLQPQHEESSEVVADDYAAEYPGTVPCHGPEAPMAAITTISNNGLLIVEPMTSSVPDVQLSQVKSKGRPKGSTLGPCGLLKKGKIGAGSFPGLAIKTETFSSKTLHDKIYLLASWLLAPRQVDSIMSKNTLIKASDIAKLTAATIRDSAGSKSITDELIKGLKPYCDSAAFVKIKSVIKPKRAAGDWTCGTCKSYVDDTLNNRLESDACLRWNHFKCSGIKKAPVWFWPQSGKKRTS